MTVPTYSSTLLYASWDPSENKRQWRTDEQGNVHSEGRIIQVVDPGAPR
ncbi:MULTISPECIES: hypothetical protein [unclassified Rhodococcus (in: high G+C Gram-positive bacteria)]|nr:hypothetical protein [Rhodococcus sp. HM1]MCK8671469.1 hypothetical protein [Rhodococcus sp. HM1]